jgi:aminopeptidase YwaD
VVAGGHYDSVPAGPGANDNASGTATVVEMARVMAADGELDEGVCFALFGSEEVGLIGSARFVESLSRAELEALEGMFNFDMVSVGTRWLLTGSPSLEQLAAGEAETDGLDYSVARSDIGGSDHASFLAAGIPAVFLHSYTKTVADDPNYHTANDIADNVRATRMAEAGRLGLDMIDALLAGG